MQISSWTTRARYLVADINALWDEKRSWFWHEPYYDEDVETYRQQCEDEFDYYYSNVEEDTRRFVPESQL